MNTTLFAAGFLIFSVLLLVFFGIFAVRRWAIPIGKTALEAYWSERWPELTDRLETLENHVDLLPRTWEEFAVDARKRQERTRWHVRRIKKELEKHGLSDEEIDSIDSTIRAVDGEGSEQSELLELSEVVGGVSESPPEDPMNAVLRRKWGNQ